MALLDLGSGSLEYEIFQKLPWLKNRWGDYWFGSIKGGAPCLDSSLGEDPSKWPASKEGMLPVAQGVHRWRLCAFNWFCKLLGYCWGRE